LLLNPLPKRLPLKKLRLLLNPLLKRLLRKLRLSRNPLPKRLPPKRLLRKLRLLNPLKRLLSKPSPQAVATTSNCPTLSYGVGFLVFF
jgi:hypothetical protein